MDATAIADRYDFAATLIAEAGALSLGYFRDQASLEVASKGLQDMASQADLETEQLIRDRIAETYPDDAFFGEETGGIAPAPGQGVWGRRSDRRHGEFRQRYSHVVRLHSLRGRRGH